MPDTGMGWNVSSRSQQKVFTSWNSHGRQMSFCLPSCSPIEGRDMLHEFVSYRQLKIHFSNVSHWNLTHSTVLKSVQQNDRKEYLQPYCIVPNQQDKKTLKCKVVSILHRHRDQFSCSLYEPLPLLQTHHISMLNTQVTKHHPQAGRQNSPTKPRGRQTSASRGWGLSLSCRCVTCWMESNYWKPRNTKHGGSAFKYMNKVYLNTWRRCI